MTRLDLRTHLLLWVLAPLLSLAAVAAVTGYWSARETADFVADHMLIGSARAIAEAARDEDGLVQVTVPPAALELFDTGYGDFVRYRVVDGAGRLLAGVPDLPLPPGGSDDAPAYEVVHRGREMRLLALHHVLAGPSRATPVTVVVGCSLDSRDAMVRSLWFAGLRQGLALIAAASVFMVFGLNRGLAPLLRLSEEVEARPAASLEPFSPAAVQSEVRPLVVAINRRTDRVRAQLEAQHRFVANAAHQFRTPLAILKLQAAYASRDDGAAGRGEALEAVQVSVGEMSCLAEQLLLLARAEPGARRERRERVALAGLARRVVGGFALLALERGIDLGLDERTPGVEAVGDGTMLGEMLANLVDNALRYCPAGSCVTVSVGLGDGRALLAVQDDGPGLPPGEEERIFERFYRVPGTAASGSGLGLSIVREVAETAGGGVEARRVPGGGLVVEVALPTP